MELSNFIFINLFLPSLLLSSNALATGPLAAFLGLATVRPGDINPAVSALKKYLHRFGYLDHSSNFTDNFDDAVQSALRTYQLNFNLDVTGLLDLSTIKQLVSPRCGVADVINGTSSMSSGRISGRHLFEFFPGNPTWPLYKQELTYAVTSSTSAVSLDPSAVRAVIARAFARWAAVTPLRFVEVGLKSKADITIGFYGGDHGDGEPFDGALQTLAHAFRPPDGRFHLDAAEEWVADGDVTTASSDNAVDLESVAVHDIGHLLGLGHSSEQEAIMFPNIATRTRKVELASDDVQGVQMLYGSNPHYDAGGIAPSTTTTRKEENGSINGGGGFVGLKVGAFELILAGTAMLILCL